MSADSEIPQGMSTEDQHFSGLAENPQTTIGQIKETLFNPHVISKKIDKEGRESTALEITNKRHEIRSLSGNITGQENTLAEIKRQTTTLNALSGGQSLALTQRTESILVQLKSFLKIKDATAGALELNINSLAAETEALSSQAEATTIELEQLKREQANIPEPKKLLEAYYEKMETVPLSNEEKRELLKPEVLAELSTEEYIALWRRLNPHFLSHVTRQGFRDHGNSILYDKLEELHGFHEGFTNIMRDNDRILRTPFALRGLEINNEEAIREWLAWVLKNETEPEAKKRLSDYFHESFSGVPKYPDGTSVHFTAQMVADYLYGGERGAEIFFVYPSDVLASQHIFAFNGAHKDFTQAQNEDRWNDVFVWPSTLDNPGIPVDSGMVFLPQNTPVDPETGSKYASEIKTIEGEEKRVLIEDEKLVSHFVEWAEGLHDESPVILAYKEFDKKSDYLMIRRDREDKERTCFDVFRKEIMQLGFPEEAAMDITHRLFGSADGIYQFQYEEKLGFGDTKKDVALKQLRSASANWKRAENTITAKEYWERYFTQHPEQKPKHVVFYDGDPTSAIYEFQQRNNIGRADVSATEGKLLGFEDRHIVDMRQDPRANRGYDELMETAHRIIAEYYHDSGE